MAEGVFDGVGDGVVVAVGHGPPHGVAVGIVVAVLLAVAVAVCVGVAVDVGQDPAQASMVRVPPLTVAAITLPLRPDSVTDCRSIPEMPSRSALKLTVASVPLPDAGGGESDSVTHVSCAKPLVS